MSPRIKQLQLGQVQGKSTGKKKHAFKAQDTLDVEGRYMSMRNKCFFDFA